MKTVMTVDDIREELRRASAAAREMPHKQKYRNRSEAVRYRDELIVAALRLGVRPHFIKQDTRLARSRIYQIKHAADERWCHDTDEPQEPWCVPDGHRVGPRGG